MAITLLVRWGMPRLTARVQSVYSLDLTPYYPLFQSFLLLMTPLLAGMVIGFLLLDQRDDRTLQAIRVTPLTLRGYLVYRMAVPVVVSILVNLVLLPASGLVQMSGVGDLVASLAAAPLAPLYALTLAALAENKVQGFALAKALGVLLIPPTLAYFVEPPAQWLFGIVPFYWPAKLVWVLHARASRAPLVLLAGLIYQALLLIPLLRAFQRRQS